MCYLLTVLVRYYGIDTGYITCSKDVKLYLKDDSGGFEGDLSLIVLALLPIENRLDIGLLHVEIIAVTNGSLEKVTDRDGELV